MLACFEPRPKEWDDHHKAVKDYFKDRPNDLLVFDIEKDPVEKLTNFFKSYFVLNITLYKHVNKSSERDETRLKNDNQVLENIKLFSDSHKIDLALLWHL